MKFKGWLSYFWLVWWGVLMSWWWIGIFEFTFETWARGMAWLYWLWIGPEILGAYYVITDKTKKDIVLTSSQVPQFIANIARPKNGGWAFTFLKGLALMMTLIIANGATIVFTYHNKWLGIASVFALFLPLFRHFWNQDV